MMHCARRVHLCHQPIAHRVTISLGPFLFWSRSVSRLCYHRRPDPYHHLNTCSRTIRPAWAPKRRSIRIRPRGVPCSTCSRRPGDIRSLRRNGSSWTCPCIPCSHGTGSRLRSHTACPHGIRSDPCRFHGWLRRRHCNTSYSLPHRFRHISLRPRSRRAQPCPHSPPPPISFACSASASPGSQRINTWLFARR